MDWSLTYRWKYVVVAKLKINVFPPVSPLFLCISVIFHQKAMVQFTIFTTVLVYFLKIYPPTPRNPFLAFFRHF